MTHGVPDLESGTDTGSDHGSELSPLDSVNSLEDELAQCLRTYRHGAEEAIARHLDALERQQTARELEISMLKAENGKLRDLLGLTHGAPAQVRLFQGVNLPDADMSKKNSKVGVSNRSTTASTVPDGPISAWGARPPVLPPGFSPGPLGHSSHHGGAAHQKGAAGKHEKELDRRRAHKNGKDAEQPGGTWEHFVAWVPQGSQLHSAEPWKPLPPGVSPVETFKSPHGSSKKKTFAHQSVNHRGADHQLLNIIPGGVSDMPPFHPMEQDGDTSMELGDEEEEDEEMEPLEVLDCWHLSTAKLDKLRRKSAGDDAKSSFTGRTSESDVEEEVGEGDLKVVSANPYIMHPHCKKRMCWDFASLGLVTYDMIMVPMSVFSFPEDDPFLFTMNWICRLFWTCDVGWSLCTGIVLKDGTVTEDVKYIFQRYLKTWFCLDMVIVGSDWAEVVLSSSGIGGIGRLLRAFRIARAVRLLRLVRMQETLSTITERIQSDSLMLAMSVMKLVVFVIAISHAIACVWFGIGKGDDESTSWVAKAGFDAASTGEKYLVALTWAFSQFSGGTGEIVPASPLERFFAIIVWLFTFFAAAIILSSMTSEFTRMHMIRGEQLQQTGALRKYMKQNGIPSNLALRITRNAQHASSGELTSDSVELLSVVSEPLKVEMHFAMYASLLNTHTFFLDVELQAPTLMRRICHEAMSTMIFAPGDIVFTRGEEPREPKMYIVWSGTLNYDCPYFDTITVKGGEHIAEAVLWTSWKHVGRLTTVTEVKLACLDAERFQDIVPRYKELGSLNPKLYAADFVDFVNESRNEQGMTDLTCLSRQRGQPRLSRSLSSFFLEASKPIS